MFDGQSLKGWKDGNMDLWHVENGAIERGIDVREANGHRVPGLAARGTGEFRDESAWGRCGCRRRAGRGGAGESCLRGRPAASPNAAANAKWNLGDRRPIRQGSNRYSGQYYEGGTQRGIVAWRGR